ncbi:hypothetical protein HK100_001974 [Physocladia obscura]|uniref:Homing endonuclease LAGLIDADG domain-containing protein n=1 Tax=Physocladia obscura TaxID=109957 RepID=A0AAD5XBF2_9FUNG|nr:hypothetical protein HK100_001974 [Physocladia obscura]
MELASGSKPGCMRGSLTDECAYSTLQLVRQSAGNVTKLKVRTEPQRLRARAIKPTSSYLAGLIEGDGTIVVPTYERSPKGKLNYPSIQIAFAAKDYPLAVVLRLLIGHGSISKRSHQAAYIYTVNNLEGLIKVVGLINGYMRTPKIGDLVSLISYLNPKVDTLNVVGLPIDVSCLGSNAWLAGFIEADGSFQVRTSLTSKIKRLALSFELTQARVNHDGYPKHHRCFGHRSFSWR